MLKILFLQKDVIRNNENDRNLQISVSQKQNFFFSIYNDSIDNIKIFQKIDFFITFKRKLKKLKQFLMLTILKRTKIKNNSNPLLIQLLILKNTLNLPNPNLLINFNNPFFLSTKALTPTIIQMPEPPTNNLLKVLLNIDIFILLPLHFPLNLFDHLFRDSFS